MKLNTIDSIIDDILLEARNNNIAESESLSRIQIEQWIVQYRSILIKQDVDKNKDINEQYIQKINNIGLELKTSPIGLVILESKISIPLSIDFNYKYGITSISDLFGNEIQIMSEKRARMQSSRRHSKSDYTCFIRDGKVYILGPMEIESINISMVAQNPADVPGFDKDEEYPVSSNMIPVIKDMIFAKELNRGFGSDKTNNSNNDEEELRGKQ